MKNIAFVAAVVFVASTGLAFAQGGAVSKDKKPGTDAIPAPATTSGTAAAGKIPGAIGPTVVQCNSGYRANMPWSRQDFDKGCQAVKAKNKP